MIPSLTVILFSSYKANQKNMISRSMKFFIPYRLKVAKYIAIGHGHSLQINQNTLEIEDN